MATAQLNIRTPEGLIQDLDQMVVSGYFKNRTEAVNEAIRLLIRRYRILLASKKIDEIGENNFGEGSLTEMMIQARKEEE